MGSVAPLFELYQRPNLLEARFDVVLDASAVVRVDAEMLESIVRWLGPHRAALIERVGLQASVAPRGLMGYVLTGILPLLGTSHPFRMFPSLHAAFADVAGNDGPSLAAELSRIALEAQGVDPTLSRLRDLLRDRRGDTDIHAAASQLAVSSRTLQRLLAASGTSFKDEQIEARLTIASELLAQGGAKIADVAGRVRVSERTLTTLFRSRRGCTPTEFRRAHGGS
jgi:AraC-like DNA-binding protein